VKEVVFVPDVGAFYNWLQYAEKFVETKKVKILDIQSYILKNNLDTKMFKDVNALGLDVIKEIENNTDYLDYSNLIYLYGKQESYNSFAV